MEICKRCKWAGKCGASSESDFCLNYEQRPLTNADRIRAMNDEELLAFLNERNACLRPHLRTETECGKYDDCETCWLDWLKQEATDES